MHAHIHTYIHIHSYTYIYIHIYTGGPPAGPQGAREKLQANVWTGSTRGKAAPNVGILLTKVQNRNKS